MTRKSNSSATLIITFTLISLYKLFLWIREKIVLNKQKKIREKWIKIENEERLIKREDNDKLIQKHKKTLIKKYKQLTYMDDYGNFQEAGFVKELDYFIKNVLYKDTSYSQDDYDYECMRIYTMVKKEAEEPSDILTDDPYEFEKQCAEILNKNGWQAQATSKSSDQGIDVIASKNGKTIAIQCKLYSKPVGNKAVQEAFSGKQFYQADYAAVVSNNTYTTSARQLAKNCNILLLSVDDLKCLDECLSN